jgi:hypothetical protein
LRQKNSLERAVLFLWGGGGGERAGMKEKCREPERRRRTSLQIVYSVT